MRGSGVPTVCGRRGGATWTRQELRPQRWDSLLRHQEQQDAALPGRQRVKVCAAGLGRCERGVELGLTDEPGTVRVGANEVGSPFDAGADDLGAVAERGDRAVPVSVATSDVSALAAARLVVSTCVSASVATGSGCSPRLATTWARTPAVSIVGR